MHGAQRHESKLYEQTSELHVRLYSGFQIIEVNILARGGGGGVGLPHFAPFFILCFLLFFRSRLWAGIANYHCTSVSGKGRRKVQLLTQLQVVPSIWPVGLVAATRNHSQSIAAATSSK